MGLKEKIKSKIVAFIKDASSKELTELANRIESYENQLYDIKQAVNMNSNTFEEVNYNVQDLNDSVENITCYNFDYISSTIEQHADLFEKLNRNINHVDERISEHINDSSIQNMMDVNSMRSEIEKYGVIATLKLSKINENG